MPRAPLRKIINQRSCTGGLTEVNGEISISRAKSHCRLRAVEPEASEWHEA